MSILFIDKIGRRSLQFWGFLAVCFVFLLLGLEQVFHMNWKYVELILFGLSFFFSNFGPNMTTFILPTEVYPTIARATCHGISAASGKLGGVVGTSMFSPVSQSLGLGPLLLLCSFVAAAGALVTFVFTKETKNVDLSSLDTDTR